MPLPVSGIVRATTNKTRPGANPTAPRAAAATAAPIAAPAPGSGPTASGLTLATTTTSSVPPSASLGTPTAAEKRTPTTRSTASSTSRGAIADPPRLIIARSRPSTVSHPSASSAPTSPVRSHSPRITSAVAASSPQYPANTCSPAVSMIDALADSVEDDEHKQDVLSALYDWAEQLAPAPAS